MSERANPLTLRKQIIDEFLEGPDKVRSGLLRQILRLVLAPPAARFADLAASFDEAVARIGLPAAAQGLVERFFPAFDIIGADDIPREGPLLITSNHPGTFDSLLIAASMPRNDLKIVAGQYPVLQSLPTVRNHLIFVPKLDPHKRMSVVRSAIQQLRDGGALLIFPRGIIEPDPDVMDGASENIEEWSPSIELFLRKVPQAQTVVTIVSGLLTPETVRNPIPKLWRDRKERQTAMEVIQVARHLLRPESISSRPLLTFGKPFTMGDLPKLEDATAFMQNIKETAHQLLDQHLRIT
jgi:hypothetical protein